MSFLEALDRFNRKERFFLVAYALGKPKFQLDAQFVSDLSRVARFPIPSDAAAYMDYHLDWLHTAAYLNSPLFAEAAHYPNEPRVNTGNQEDIDLLIAFADASVTRVVMVEAKAETGWTNGQLRSKAKRLERIFGRDGGGVAGVIPTFVLASPKESKGVNTSEWPDWMSGPDNRPVWLQLPVPTDRWRVIGCDEDGRPSSRRLRFKVVLPT
jgi:hypothetical protein